MTRRLTYAGTCMGHQPRPSGAPTGWPHNAMPCPCLLIPAFPTACHLTTIWAEDIILRHPLAWEREREISYLFSSDGAAWPATPPPQLLRVADGHSPHREGSGDRGLRWRARLQSPSVRPAHHVLARRTENQFGRACNGPPEDMWRRHNGGYRTSSATQCKLRRVMGETVAPRRRAPNRNVYRFDRHCWSLAHVTAVRARLSRPPAD